LFDTVGRNFPLVLAVLWSIAVVVGLIQWATTTWSSQGRLVFSAIGTLNILMIVGLVGWMRQRTAVRVISVLFGFLLLISAAAPFVWIQPAYQVADLEVPERVVPRNLTIVDQDFGGKLRLVGYELLDETAEPGQAVEVVLIWEVLARMERNWSVFVHLNDPVVGTPVAQRDMFLGQGLLATTFLEPGDQIVNHYQLMLSSTTYAPGELALTVGLYDYQTVDQERLLTVEGADAVVLDRIVVEALDGAFPNPVNINFENQVALVGYDLTPRRAGAGESLEVTLYLRSLKPFEADYTVFGQVVDADTTRWASDDQGQTTSEWVEGEVTAVTLNLDLDGETPADVYPVIVGLYIQTAGGGFDRLQIMTAEGRLTDDFLRLTQVRVD
jgi:hypothetical protein